MTEPTEIPYPEHAKLTKVSDHSNAIGDFLDWMEDQGIQRMVRRIDLTDRHLTDRHHPCLACDAETDDTGIEGWIHDRRPIRKLLAEYFEIDEDKLEAEKRAMLAELRDTAAARARS